MKIIEEEREYDEEKDSFIAKVRGTDISEAEKKVINNLDVTERMRKCLKGHSIKIEEDSREKAKIEVNILKRQLNDMVVNVEARVKEIEKWLQKEES